jgi:hypothetical protein
MRGLAAVTQKGMTLQAPPLPSKFMDPATQ